MHPSRLLTGIKPSGTPHVGNLIGAIRPGLTLTAQREEPAYYFVADYHALTVIQDPGEMTRLIREVAASWLAFGLDPEKDVFYRQSAVPETFELAWVFACVCGKGLMNRAHAYKAAVAENEAKGGSDPDAGISMGLFSYPVLMAADILVVAGTEVPVGQDQKQHVEIARDIAVRFNATFGEGILPIPTPIIGEDTGVLPGIDGRKMSKSYGNVIPLFAPEDQLRKVVYRIKTDSSAPGEPKNPDETLLFQIYRHFGTAEQTAEMRKEYENGIGWKDAKDALFDVLNAALAEPRRRYDELMQDPATLDGILDAGAERARAITKPLLAEVRRAVGI